MSRLVNAATAAAMLARPGSPAGIDPNDPVWSALRKSQGISERTAQVLTHVLRGREQPYYPDMFVGSYEFYHRQTFGATASAQYSFFNVAEQKYVTDLPGNGSGLPADHAFLYTGISFQLDTGITLAGVADADGSQIQQTPAEVYPGTTELTAKNAEQVRRIMIQGDVSVFLRGSVFDKFYGLIRAPQAGGVRMDVALAGTTAATHLIAAANVNNGMPHFQNVRQLRRQLVLPNQPFKVTVDFQDTALALTCNGVLTARIHGVLVRPRG